MSSAWKLIIEDDAGNQIVVPFTREVITVGRKEGNTIRLTERNVSRNHAKLSKENGHVVLEDLQSFNGIKLNGDRIDGRVLIHEGDTIQIGDYHLALHSHQVAAANQVTQDIGLPAAALNSKSGGLAIGQSGEGDAFAGDTQRWSPPHAAQSQPTLNERAALRSDEGASPVITTRPASGEGKAAVRENTDDGPEQGAADLLDAMEVGASFAVRDEDQEPTARLLAAASTATVPPAEPVAAPPASVPSAAANLRAPSSPGLSPASIAQAASTVPKTNPQDLAPATPSRPPRQIIDASMLEAMAQTEAFPAASAPAEDVSAPRLVVVSTIFAGSTFQLRTAEAVIGRTEDNDITIEHKSVSRNHAKVVREGDRVRIFDLKSANGVLVNDEEVEAAVLRSGDIVELGRVRIRFVAVGERFTLSPDEVERARMIDTAGDDTDGFSGTNLTNPARSRDRDAPSAAPAFTTPGAVENSGLRWALAGGVVVLAVIGLLFALKGSGSTGVTPSKEPLTKKELESRDSGAASDASTQPGSEAQETKPTRAARTEPAANHASPTDAPSTDAEASERTAKTANAGDPIETSPAPEGAERAETMQGRPSQAEATPPEKKEGSSGAADANDGSAPEKSAGRDTEPRRESPSERQRARPTERLTDADVERLLTEVQAKMTAGDPEGARRIFRRVAEKRPDHKRVQLLKNFPALK